MESGGEEHVLDWDAMAEEELKSIEAAYAASKRRSSLPDFEALDRRYRTRRLPSWASPATTPSRSSTVDRRRSRDGDDDSVCSPGSGVWAMAPPRCRVDLKVRYPALTFDGHIVYSRTAPEVEQATLDILDKINAMKQDTDQVSLGFDIEWRPTFKRGEAPRKAAVMQICMDTSKCYVMHIFHSGIPPILKSLLEDHSSVKVGICIANDARKITRDYDVGVEPLGDLSGYANLKLTGAPRNWSLSSLTEMLTCKQVEKPSKIRMGNWEAEVLSKEQIHYAATDAFASWYLYQVLKSFPDVKSENGALEKVNDVIS